MEMKEELSALNEEALEKVVGGIINAGDGPSNPGSPGNPDPDPILVDDPDSCNYRLADNNGIMRCTATFAQKSDKCLNCTAEKLFTLSKY